MVTRSIVIAAEPAEILPHARYFGLLMDGMMGKDFETCLDGLKSRCEAAVPEEPTEEPSEG